MAGDVEKGQKLLEAIDHKQFAEALTLIAEGADVNLPYTGTFALHMAIEHGSQEVVEALVNAGADLMAQDACGFHAFARACNSRQKDVAKFLLSSGADINAPIGTEGGTVLHMFLERPNVDMVEFLLGFDALNVNAQNNYGQTPLHFAAKMDDRKKTLRAEVEVYLTAVHLLERGALSNIGDDHGMTPLHLAAKTGNKDMIRLLLRNNAEKNARNDQLETPLHLAAAREPFLGLDFLLSRGEDVNATTVDLNTPLHYAVKKID